MKLKAMIAALVLGTSSLAMAAPGATAARPAPSYRSPGWQKPLLITSNLSLARGGAREVLAVGTQRKFTQLTLTGVSGQTAIDSLVITFGNGQKQVVRGIKNLMAGASTTIDLQGNAREIKTIAVKGESVDRMSRHRTQRSAIQISAV